MTAAGSRTEAVQARFETLRRVVSILFVAAGIATVVLFLLFPRAAAYGWLIAFAVFSQIALGSLALLLIDNLTGTSWGRAFGPFFHGLLFGVPLTAIFWIAIAVNLREIYPWAASPAWIPHDVLQIYLNPIAYWLRSIVAFAGWILFAALLLRERIGRLAAGIGLAFYGLSSYAMGFDWILSISAPFISNSFNAQMAVQAILAALATAALFGPASSDTQAKTDLGAFMLAGALAVFYFSLMSLIVFWYGNLPDQAQWYLDRAGLWAYAAAIAVFFGAALPIVSLLWGSVRGSRGALRLAGLSILVGVTVHFVWLLAPMAHPLTWVCVIVFGIAMAGMLIAAQHWGENLLHKRELGYDR